METFTFIKYANGKEKEDCAKSLAALKGCFQFCPPWIQRKVSNFAANPGSKQLTLSFKRQGQRVVLRKYKEIL